MPADSPIILPREFTALPEGVPINAAQELVVPHMDKEYNILFCAPTASGKSTAIYMCGNKYLEQGKRICYIGIMRALAQEKADDLDDPDHPWNDVARTVISGEYVHDADKQREIDDALFICITPESLASRLRHPNSERNKFLSQIGLLVVDEVHLIGEQGRGSHLEVALMDFAYNYPQTQLLALSATVPNVQEVGAFMSGLNGKHTQVIVSNYRSVPLNRHFIPIPAYLGMEAQKRAVMDMAVSIRQQKPDQQFMYAVFSKQFGSDLQKYMNEECGIGAEFHNANLERDDRRTIEKNFKGRGLFDLISTSTLFTGVNLPARNVVVTAVTAGMKDIPAHTLNQAIGRAGRPRYDKEGDAYIGIPTKRRDAPEEDEEFKRHKNRILNGEDVESWMLERAELATHFLGAVYTGRVKNEATFLSWIKRTLAYQQLPVKVRDAEVIRILTSLVDLLKNKHLRMIYVYNEEYRLTPRGKIAAQMYLNPFHFADLLKNLSEYFALDAPGDQELAKAFGACSDFASLASRKELNFCHSFWAGTIGQDYIKSCSVCLYRVKGEKVPIELYNIDYLVRDNAPRYHVACQRILNEAPDDAWDVTQDRLDTIFHRLIKKCSEQEAELALAKFTKRERRVLNEMGLYTVDEVLSNMSQVKEVITDERLFALNLVDASGAPKRTLLSIGRSNRRGGR